MEHGACFAGVILSTLEIGIVIRYLVKFLGWKGKEKHRTEKSLGLGILMFLVSQINGLFANSYWIVVLIDALMLMAFSYINLKGKLMRQIFVSILPFLVVVVTNIWLMQIFAWSREISVLSYFSNLKGIHLTGPILSKIILWIVLEIIIFIWKREKIVLSGGTYVLAYGLILTAIVMETIIFYTISLVNNRTVSGLLLILSTGMVGISILLAYSIFKIGIQNDKLTEYEKLQIQYQENEQRVKEIQQTELRYRQGLHDYRNHCMDMQHLLIQKEYSALEVYLHDLTKCYVCQNEYITVRNVFINAVLNNKIYQCEEEKIGITCFISGNMEGIPGMKFSIILFNLLDNAIEACRMLPENKRKIQVQMNREEEAVDLIIKNTIGASILSENPELHTTKETYTQHGNGHRIVEKTVEELDGILEYYEEDKQFCVHVYFLLTD